MMRLGQLILVLFYRNPPVKIIALPLARCARADRANARRGSLILARGFFRPPLHPLGSRALPVENPATLARGGRAFSPWGAGTLAGACCVSGDTPAARRGSGLTLAGQPARPLDGALAEALSVLLPWLFLLAPPSH